MKNSLRFAFIASALMLSGSLQAGTLAGNYSATCKDCVLRLDTKELVCGSCEDKKGALVKDAKIEVSKVPMVDDVIGSLNANIANCDGRLTDTIACAEPINPTLTPVNPPAK